MSVSAIDYAEEIDGPWLTAMLREAGFLGEEGGVQDFALEDLGGVGRGFLSGVVRVRLTYDAPAPDAPKSLIVKLPAADPDHRALGVTFQAYERELRFYRDLAKTTPVRAPHCFQTLGDGGSAVLIIEDAELWTPGDQVYGLSLAQVENTLQEAAKLHAHWWGAPELEGYHWLPRSPFDFRTIFAERWPGFLAEYGHFLSPGGQGLGHQMAASGPALQAAVEAAPVTLAHCDLRADNLMFDGPDGEPVMILDWQLMSRSMAALDVARLVSGSLETALPQAAYKKIVAKWHGQISALGVEDYPFETAWRDFRVAVLHVLYMPVCFHGDVSHEGARAVRFLEAQIQRSFRVAEEVAAIDALMES